ncbi:hypothetical protein Goklo_022826, partial [Gossypium klotzschianum]|nr:hypothetical protein [Gossypium klotzschianum]
MMELGPFRINNDGKTLFRNGCAWNNVANVIFLESPAGVGFSYSNTSSDYHHIGDKSTAKDAYTFLVNWLERFPQYKTRDFYITGESYAGHYVPQLAYTILLNNKNANQTLINLKGIAGDIDGYNIYAPLCLLDFSSSIKNSNDSVNSFNPCSDYYMISYLNRPEVQTALHAGVAKWHKC